MRLPLARCLLLVLPLLLPGLPAAAGETEWQEIAPGVTARMISSDLLSGGRMMVGLELRMPPGVNTYWRVPGETGIPTSIAIEGSEGIAGHRVVWPHPGRETTRGYVDHVYRGHLVLPVELELESPAAHLRAQAVLGICSEICVPVAASFELPLEGRTPDRPQALALAQAEALAPLPWPGPGAPVGEVGLAPDGAALLLPVDPLGLDPASLIVDAGPSGALFGPPEIEAGGTLLRVPVLGRLPRVGAAALPVTVTFLTREGSFELLRSVALDGST